MTRRGFELRETHTSWVFLADGDVWKIKKPVDLGFLDFTTVEARRRACDAEVRLNRRLAPRVYHGVVPVVRDSTGAHRIDPEADGETVDWAVHMVRLPDDQRADIRLAEGRLTLEHIDRIAERVARFHETCRVDGETSRYGTPEAIAANVRENFEQTRGAIREHLDADEAEEIERWQLTFLDRHSADFRDRIAKGRVRDGHGDLRLEHVYLADRNEAPPDLAIIDCIEFNERFRFADVCADAAFLSMDLARHGRSDLAEAFLAAYAREANDYDLFRLVDFYESYRAYVRGKVTTILAADPDASSQTRRRAAGQARRHFLLALASERRRLVEPALVAVGGIIGSGKSTIARQLSTALQAPVVETDRTRKFMMGAKPTDDLSTGTWTGAYDPEFTEEVYDEVFRRAATVLESGRSVIVDASFRTRAMRRRAARLAERHALPFYFVETRAPAETCKQRLAARADEEGQVSDARLEIFDDFAGRWEPADELSREQHLVLDTTKTIEDNVERLRVALPAWPSELTG